ncbi:MAG: hypothetical protein HZC41_13915 [Chloroflexi bacterium]|nr:hypothetical protein [Chloroflexota bacterium]
MRLFRGRRQRWKIGCFALLLPLIFCWLSMFLYAKFGGDWAAARVLPVPPDSTLVSQTTYTEYDYHNRLRLYVTPGSLAAMREWFMKHRIPMSPMDGILETQDTFYCSLPQYGTGDNVYNFLFTAAFLTDVSWSNFYKFAPICFYACVYSTPDAVGYEELKAVESTIPLGLVAVTLNSCWPTW